MNELFEKIKTWITSNPILAAAAALAASIVVLPFLKKAISPARRKRRSIKVKPVVKRKTVNRLPRKTKTVKKGLKPWQIKGSLAAKRRMAQIRKKR